MAACRFHAAIAGSYDIAHDTRWLVHYTVVKIHRLVRACQ